MVRSFQCAAMHIRKWVSMPRIWLTAILVPIFLYELKGIGAYCVANHTAISPWVYPFVIYNSYFIFVLYANFIFLTADAPFMEDWQLFFLVRCGKKRWYFGQVLYLIVTSILYFLFILGVIWIYLIPYMEFQWDWGAILTTLSREPVRGVAKVNPYILQSFTAVSATVCSLLLNILMGFFLGLLTFDLNLFFGRGAGNVAAIFLVIQEFFIDFYLPEASAARYFTPLLWVRLSYYTDREWGIPLWYPFLMLAVLILILVFWGLRLVQRRHFEVQEEM